VARSLYLPELQRVFGFLRVPEEHEYDRPDKLRALVQCFIVEPRAPLDISCFHAPSCLRCELRRAAAECGALEALAPLLTEQRIILGGRECVSRCLDRPEIFDAVEAMQHDALRMLLRWRPQPQDVNARDEDLGGMTALQFAVDEGFGACVTELLAAPFILVDAVARQHRTALNYAVSHRNVRMVAQLLAAGANPLVLEPGAVHGVTGRAGNSPLHRAAAVVPDPGAVCVRLLAAAAVRTGRSLDTLATPGQPNTTALGCALLARAFPAAAALRFCGASHFHLARTDDAQRYRALVPHLPPQVVPFFFAETLPEWTPQLHRFCPPACKAAVLELLRCGERHRRAIAADAGTDEGAALWRLPAPLLQRVVATVVSAWCASPPWPFELDAFEAAQAAAAQ
jgi:hypothetical protein